MKKSSPFYKTGVSSSPLFNRKVKKAGKKLGKAIIKADEVGPNMHEGLIHTKKSIRLKKSADRKYKKAMAIGKNLSPEEQIEATKLAYDRITANYQKKNNL